MLVILSNLLIKVWIYKLVKLKFCCFKSLPVQFPIKFNFYKLLQIKKIKRTNNIYWTKKTSDAINIRKQVMQ